MNKISVDVRKINEEGLDYLSRVLNTEIPDLMYLYGVLMELEDTHVCILNADDISEDSSFIVKAIADTAADHGNISVEFLGSDDSRHKIVMDIAQLNVRGHDYLAELFDLPDYYGRNLDAFYDCMSEMDDTRIVMINLDDINEFSLNVIKILDEVAEEYQNLKISYEYDEVRDMDEED